MIFRSSCRDETGFASDLLGCGTLGECAVVDVPPKPADMVALLRANRGLGDG